MPLYNRFIVLFLLSSCIAVAQTTVAPSASIPSQQEIADLKAKAEAGDPNAQVKLGQWYEDGTGVPVNHVAAVTWYRKAAERGDPAGENNLGIMYRLGWGVNKDFEEAVRWYRQAAKQGYANACFNLGAAYYNGDGVHPDLPRAYAWFAIAQHAGSSNAADAIQRVGEEFRNISISEGYMEAGRLLEAGDEVPQDLAEAANWYRKAADRSDPEAQWKLSELYAIGRGVPKDPNVAANWRAKALKSNSPKLMVDYGNMLRTGADVPQDLKAAVEWYRKAAERGSTVGTFNLALMYAQGLGVSRDPGKAYVLLASVAIGKGMGRGDLPAKASKALQELEKTMSAPEIEQAHKEVKKRWPRITFRTEVKK